MHTKSVIKSVRLSTFKARLVADKIRGMHVSKAIDTLEHLNKKAAKHFLKALLSAIANAENNHDMDIDELSIVEVYVDQGPVMKRMMPRARGRGDRILKPSCHLTVVVGDLSKATVLNQSGDK